MYGAIPVFIMLQSCGWNAVIVNWGIICKIPLGANIEGKVYLFFDEIQEVKDWEKCINSFRVTLDCDVYITDSNAKLLSGGMPYLARMRLPSCTSTICSTPFSSRTL